ncbi:hypothetical protein KTT56_00250 [Pseudomonas viridiflava]|nr:hypothetical protein KTT56_00250 [Pseudomonas viridiflava]
MADAEFVSDMIVVLDSGIQTKRNSTIDKLYKEYDEGFPQLELYYEIIMNFHSDLVEHMKDIRGTFITKSYVMHSLFCAYAAIRYGFPGSAEFVAIPSKTHKIDYSVAIPKLMELAEAHENQEDEGPLRLYVEACTSSTTQQTSRKVRTRFLSNALLGV